MNLIFTIAPPALTTPLRKCDRAETKCRLWQLKKTLRKECGLMTGDCPTTRQIAAASAVKNYTHLLVEVFASFFLHGRRKRGQNMANKSLFRADRGHEVHEMVQRTATRGRSTQAITLSIRLHPVPARGAPKASIYHV